MQHIPAQEGTGEGVSSSMPPLSVGATLSVARESKGLTIDQVAANLRIGPKQVIAIENNAFDQLPDAMIARGFIRNYAKLLGLDSDPLIAKLKMQQPDVTQKTISMSSANIVMSEAQKRSMMMYVWASVLVLVGLLVWYAYVEWMPTINQELNSAKTAISDMAPSQLFEEKPIAISAQEPAPIVAPSTAALVPDTAEIPPPTAVTSTSLGGREEAALTSPAPVAGESAEVSPASNPSASNTQVASIQALNPQAPVPVQNPATTSAPEPIKQTATHSNVEKAKTSKSLVVDCKETTWVHVRDANGLVIFDRVLPAGSHEVITGQSPLGVVIGNAPATTLKYGQDAVDLSSFTKIRVARLTLE